MTFLEVLEAEAAAVADGTAEACAAPLPGSDGVTCERVADHLHIAEMVRDMHAGHDAGQWTTWPVA